MWADLFFEETPEFVFDKELIVGLSDTFKCRWKLEDNKFVNEASTEVGVAGFFAFKNKEKFSKLSISKSLVRGFLSENYTFDEIESFTLSNCLLFSINNFLKPEFKCSLITFIEISGSS